MLEVEVRRIMHDRTELYTRAVQPILWIGVFAPVMEKLRVVPIPNVTYMEFITPGVLVQSITFVSIFYGLTVIWERDLGVLNKLLVAPVSRSALVIGKALSAGVRGIFQSLIIILLAELLGVRIILNPFYLLLAAFLVVMFCAAFASLSIFIASLLKTRERFMGIGQAITMPLFFASNAIYPIALMPNWLKAVATVNPLSYAVEGLRALMITGDLATVPLDFLVSFIFVAITIVIASQTFNRIIE
ncbi:MAG: ABC transporter permease [Candidatus Brockarchaeota archaeon]|nr:ABC transporter permease [Candidatus Brockarchaeota archaeon]MBO3768308.1 ABC transporter permease [Candidatus Brockarchaeota archaeon]MBO3800921.1 ABC transporter permease [Candidatus Brockarchaeota archaeon]